MQHTAIPSRQPLDASSYDDGLEPILVTSIDTSMSGSEGGQDDDIPSIQEVLTALEDPDCRKIILTAETPMKADELSDVCDIPRSTVYRKLERLQVASLVEEHVEVHPDGGRIHRYERNIDHLRITLTEGEAEFDIERPRQTAADKLEEIWSRMGEKI
jgi:DNA-binding transcriptional ArsR family regulator